MYLYWLGTSTSFLPCTSLFCSSSIFSPLSFQCLPPFHFPYLKVTHMGGVAHTEDANLAKARRDAAEKAKQAKVRQEAQEAAKQQAANERKAATAEAPPSQDGPAHPKTASSSSNNNNNGGALSPVGEHDEEKNDQNGNKVAKPASDAKGEGVSGGASVASSTETEQTKASFPGVLASAAAPLPPKRRPGERWLVPTTTWILKDPLAAHGYTVRKIR